MTKENGAGPGETGSLDGAGGLIHDQHSTTSLEMMKVTKRLEDSITWSHEMLGKINGRGRKSPG